MKISHDASAEVFLAALTALEPIYTAGVELADESEVGGLSAWHVTLVSAQDYEPIFVDGYLLSGTNTAVTVSGVGYSGSCPDWQHLRDKGGRTNVVISPPPLLESQTLP